MMKNIMVLLTVAVLGGSQVVGMNLVKSHGMSSMEKNLFIKELKQAQMRKRGQNLLKNDSSIVSEILGKNNAVNNSNEGSLKNALNNAEKLLNLIQDKYHNNRKNMTKINDKEFFDNIKKLEVEQVEAKKQGFFGSLCNKIKNNKAKIAAGVVGITLLAGAAYYMLSNPVSAINVVAQPVSSAFKSCYSHSYVLGASIPSNVCYYAAEFNRNFQNIIL